MSAAAVHIPQRSTPTDVTVVRYDKDRSHRVVFAPNGKLVALLDFHAATLYAKVLRDNAARARAGINDKPALIARTRGQVAASDGMVVVTKDIEVVARYTPDDADYQADRIAACADIARTEHWSDVDKFHAGGVKVKTFLGLPVCTSLQEYERLGDR